MVLPICRWNPIEELQLYGIFMYGVAMADPVLCAMPDLLNCSRVGRGPLKGLLAKSGRPSLKTCATYVVAAERVNEVRLSTT
jgi:hypothetical protein